MIKRNFKIKKEDNFQMIYEILNEKSLKHDNDALNCLGFIHQSGIGGKERCTSLSLQYFRAAAANGDPMANFVCFCELPDDHEKKFPYFINALI